MKEKDAKINFKEHQLILYVEKKDGSYGPIRTGSYLSKNYIDDFWLKRKNMEKEFIEKIKNKEASPIAFYMHLVELSPSELASRVGLSVRKVQKHMKAETFGTIRLDELKRYSEVFNVPISSMLQAVVTRNKNLRLLQESTDNPYFEILRIEVGKK